MDDYGLSSANEILRIARLLKNHRLLSLTQLDKALQEAEKLEAYGIDNLSYMQEILDYNGEVAAKEAQEQANFEHEKELIVA